MEIHRVVIAPYSAPQMFALADDINSYPAFLPWCERAAVLRDGEKVTATLHINYRGLKVSFATRNRHLQNRQIDIRLESGPLSSLTGDWRFTAIEPRRCRVEFNLHYAFRGGLMTAIFSQLFNRFFARFMDSFIARAKTVYGETIKVEVADVADDVCSLSLPAGATVEDALRECKITADKVGVFGKVCLPTQKLQSGDRIEVYGPLINDPRAARRERTRRR